MHLPVDRVYQTVYSLLSLARQGNVGNKFSTIFTKSRQPLPHPADQLGQFDVHFICSGPNYAVAGPETNTVQLNRKRIELNVLNEGLHAGDICFGYVTQKQKCNVEFFWECYST